jgi:hypothetical protein
VNEETELDILSHHFDVIVDDKVVWTGKDIYEAFRMKQKLAAETGVNAIVKVSAQVKLDIESDDEEG